MRNKFLIAGLILACNVLRSEDLSIRLDESIITSENSGATLSNTPRNVTIISKEEIQKSGANTVSEILRRSSSVVVRQISGSNPSFDLRGQGEAAASNVLVLLNGIPLNSIDLSGAVTDNIPVENIERIEIIPSGGSVLYGGGAIGGMINIITNSFSQKKPYGILSGKAGSYGLLKSQGIFGTSIGENLFAQVNYLNEKKDGYREYSETSLENVGTNLIYNLENGKIIFKYDYTKNDFEAPGSLTKVEVEEDRTQVSPYAFTMKGNKEQNNFVIDYSNEISKNIELKMLGAYTRNNYISDASIYKTENIYYKPSIKYSYLDNSYFVFGGDLSDGKTTDFAYGNGSSEKNSLGFYAINSYNFNKFNFTQGYRIEEIDFERNKNALYNQSEENEFKENAIELTGSYSYSNTGITYLNYSTGFRTPNVDELNFWVGDIKVQNTETYELGVKDYINNTFISLSLFHIKAKNEIYYDPDVLNPSSWSGVGANTNLDGNTTRKGIEIFVENTFEKLTVTKSLTYMETEFEKDKSIPFVPNFRATLNLNYNFNEKLNFNTSIEYNGSMYKSGDFNNLDEKLNDYFIVGANLNYEYNEQLSIDVGVANIFNEKYYNFVAYPDAYYPAEERNYYVGFKYNFN